MPKLNRQFFLNALLVIVAFTVGLLLFIRVFQQFDASTPGIAIDMDIDTFRGGTLNYEIDDVLSPPWSLIFLLPLGWMSFEVGWAVIGYVTTLVVLLSVPRRESSRGVYIAAVLLAVLGYPTLRSIIDGNYEFMVTAGAALCVWAYRTRNPYWMALGVLLVSFKPQSSALFLLVLGMHLVLQWEPRRWLSVAGIVFAVVVATLIWKGQDWLAVMLANPTRGSIMDSSLVSSMSRTGVVPMWLTQIIRGIVLIITLALAFITRPTLSREKAGFLIAGMLLLAPYAAGNSTLGIYAVGVIPLFMRERRWGLLLVVLINLPYLATGQTTLLFNYSAYYWTAVWLTCWGVLGWSVYRRAAVTRQAGKAAAVRL